MPALTVLGNPTKNTYLTIEPNKIAIEVEAAAAIKSGQPVKLGTDGKVSVWVKTDALNLLVGYAYQDAAIGDLLTIFTRGYAIIYALSAAAADAGLGTVQGYNTANAATDGEIEGTKGYSTYDNPGAGENANGWILDPATGAYESMRVLLMN